MKDEALFADPIGSEFSTQYRNALARKAAAAKMVQDAAANTGGAGYHGGKVFIVGNPLGSIAQSIGGAVMSRMADKDAADAQMAQNAAQQDWSNRYAAALPEQQQGLLIEARNKGLKYDLESAFRKEEADRIERGEQLAADRVAKAEEAERARIEAGEQKAADRVARSDDIRLRATTPNVNVNFGGGRGKAPSGYEWDGDNLKPITGGPADKQPGAKPLTAKQLETQRGFMDLKSSLDSYDKMLDAYDFRGKSALDPAQRAALEGAYTDLQMKLKTLYELGAPQAGDLKLLEQSLSNPVSLRGTLSGTAFGRDTHKAKTAQIRKLLTNSQANFEKQFGKATPEAASNQPKAVANQAEWQALPAGTPYVLPDGRKGVR